MSALLDIADLETLEGWEYFVNEATLSNPARRCVANAKFMRCVDNEPGARQMAKLQIPAAEMMFWNKGLVEEVALAIEQCCQLQCELQLEEVQELSDSVLERQNVHLHRERQRIIEGFQHSPLVQRAMGLNGAEFRPERIRFADDEP